MCDVCNGDFHCQCRQESLSTNRGKDREGWKRKTKIITVTFRWPFEHELPKNERNNHIAIHIDTIRKKLSKVLSSCRSTLVMLDRASQTRVYLYNDSRHRKCNQMNEM